MLIQTQVKDVFLLRTLYILTAITCLFDLFYMNIRLEFLAGLPVFALMWCSYKFGDSGIGMVTGSIVGAKIGAAVVMEINLSAIHPIAEMVAGEFVGASAGILAWIIAWKSEWAKKKIMKYVIAAPLVTVITACFFIGFYKTSPIAYERTVLGVVGGIGGLAVGTVAVIIVFLIALGFTVIALLLINKSRFIVFAGKTYSEFINLPVKISAFLLFPPLSFAYAFYLFSTVHLPKLGLYALIAGTALVLSVIFMYLYNLFLLHFKIASENEKERWDYISAYPRLFCEKHLLKPVRTRNALFYFDVQCRSKYCRHTFITGIRVAGLIGGNIDKYRKDRDMVYVSLWSEPDKKARNADIDVLGIIETEGVSYDHAINAVLMALVNDASRPRDYIKKIPVVISGNPSISEGAMKILRHEFGGIAREKKLGLFLEDDLEGNKSFSFYACLREK